MKSPVKKINLAGCVILKKNKILLLHRIQTDWYELPGGKIETEETPEEAAKRELKEELLCDVELIKKLGEKDFEENGYKMGYTWFLAEINNKQLPQIGEPDKFSEYVYVPLTELSKRKLSTNMQNFLAAIITKTIKLPAEN